MSKIGKISISIPEKVKVVLAGNIINIEGPLGKKSVDIDLEMFNLDIKEGKEISIKPKKIDQNSKRLWGMNRSLINNAVIGSSTGYEKTLELVGVGYRAALKGKQLNLQLGYSHDINYDIPDGIKIEAEDNKPTLSLELKYYSGNPVISAFERVSKPGRRIFSSAESLPKVNNGLGIAIVSTPKGVMTDIDARKQRVGGEIICKVF